MKTILPIIGIGLLTCGTALAQTPSVIRVKGGAGGEKSVPVADRYRYDQFYAGKVLFQNGTSAVARFNYNVLLGEMQFIDSRGDTLALANEPIVRMVGVDNPGTSAQPSRQDVFWYDPKAGYLEIITDYDVAKLAVKQGLKTVKKERRGGYEQSSGASAITTYQFYSGGNTSISKLDSKGDLLLIKDKTYFIIDQNNRFYPATKASVLKLFGKHREQVTTYLTTETIDFNQEKDLQKLLNYCSELM